MASFHFPKDVNAALVQSEHACDGCFASVWLSTARCANSLVPTTTTSRISGMYLTRLAPGRCANLGLRDRMAIMTPNEANARIMVVLLT